MGDDNTPTGSMRWLPFAGGVALCCKNEAKRWKVVHSHYTLCVVHRGRAEWHYRHRYFSVAPGALYVCEPGEVHTTCRIACAGDYTVFFVDPEVVLRMAGSPSREGPHFEPEGVRSPELCLALMGFRDRLEAADPEVTEQGLAALVSLLLEHASPRPSLEPVSDDAIGRARRYLQDTLHSDPTSVIRLGPIAAELRVSYHALVRGFTRRYSMAPYEFVTALRAQGALSDLRRGPSGECGSLAALAQRWGYSDGPHMARAFREHWGASPRDIAKDLCPSWLNRRRDGGD